MITAEISTIITRLLDGEGKTGDQDKLDQWLALSPENQQAYKEMSLAHALSARVVKAPPTDTKADFAALQQRLTQAPPAGKQIPFRPKKKPPYLALAASMLLLVVAGYFLFFFPSDAENGGKTIQQFSSNAKVNFPASLPDGSEISLNANTELALLEGFDQKERKVRLKGEAFFDVARNPQKPFIIDAGKAQVKVLGTSFNVFAPEGSEQIRVAVATGKVEVSSGSEKTILTPDQMALVNTQDGSIQMLPATALNEYFWKDSTLIFSGTPLPEAIEVINRFYPTQLILGPGLENEKLTSRFAKKDIQTISEAIALGISAHTEKQKESIVIKR